MFRPNASESLEQRGSAWSTLAPFLCRAAMSDRKYEQFLPVTLTSVAE